jgi:hypothetical protein
MADDAARALLRGRLRAGRANGTGAELGSNVFARWPMADASDAPNSGLSVSDTG